MKNMRDGKLDCEKEKPEWLRMKANSKLREEQTEKGNEPKDYFPRITGKLNEK